MSRANSRRGLAHHPLHFSGCNDDGDKRTPPGVPSESRRTRPVCLRAANMLTTIELGGLEMEGQRARSHGARPVRGAHTNNACDFSSPCDANALMTKLTRCAAIRAWTSKLGEALFRDRLTVCVFQPFDFATARPHAPCVAVTTYPCGVVSLRRRVLAAPYSCRATLS